MRAARTDHNQTEIVNALRKLGCSVAVTSALGKGFPDLVVGWRGRNYLLEIKDGKKTASKRKLTPDEQKFHDFWLGEVKVVESVDDAYRAVNAMQ
jgi:Holliday junction resolvase